MKEGRGGLEGGGGLWGCGGEEMKGIKEKHCSIIIQVLSHVMPCTCRAVVFLFLFLFLFSLIASYQWYRSERA